MVTVNGPVLCQNPCLKAVNKASSGLTFCIELLSNFSGGESGGRGGTANKRI